MKRSFNKRGLLVFIAGLLIEALVLSSVPVYAQSLSEAEQKKAEIQSNLDEANALVANLKASERTKKDKIDTISREISDLEKESQVAEGEISSIGKDIEDISSEIEKTKEDLTNKESDMSIRIIYSYENGRHNFLNALFSSGSITEFLNVIQYSIDIAKYDKEAMESYEQTIQVLSQQTDALAQKQEDAQRLVSDNNDRLEAISALKSAQENELSGIEEELTDAKAIAEVYEMEMQAQNEVLSAIQAAIAAEKAAAEQAAREQAEKEAAEKAAAEQAKKEAEESDSEESEDSEEEGGEDVEPSDNQEAEEETPEPEPSSNNTSGFTWPCPASKRITSDFGPRVSPTAGASTNHKGIDIGAPTGSSIVAAQDGKVILSQYSNSAGNYIIVSHGANSAGKIVCTVYMHCSERLVSVGAKVKKGQQIAKVGSTGYSTGPHLHFGVSEDGTYVSPWNYL